MERIFVIIGKTNRLYSRITIDDNGRSEDDIKNLLEKEYNRYVPIFEKLNEVAVIMEVDKYGKYLDDELRKD